MSDYMMILEKLSHRNQMQGCVLSLEGPKALAEQLSHPEKSFPSIHIAGSNGKGSVSLKIAHTLLLSGYKVGLFTSPHLFSFRERILFQGEMIPEQTIASVIEEIFSLCEEVKLQPTFFEILTFAAFEYFRKQSVDVAVIETGLGGRLDATNVVDSILTVITSISKEHTDLLGGTEDQIAREKAGILKAGVPLVLGPKALYPSILERALSLAVPVYVAQPIKGFYDKENQEVARVALSLLSPSFPQVVSHIEEGIQVRPACRMEAMGPFVLDVAHNPEAFVRLIESMHELYPGRKIGAILGLSQDKDTLSCLQILVPHLEWIYLVEGKTPRAMKKELLAQQLRSLSFFRFTCAESVEDAIAQVKERSSGSWDLTLISGSFYIMSDAKRVLGDGVESDPLYLNEIGPRYSLG